MRRHKARKSSITFFFLLLLNHTATAVKIKDVILLWQHIAMLLSNSTFLIFAVLVV